MSWPPKPRVFAAPAVPPTDAMNAPGSLRIKDMQPIRLATGRVCTGAWSGEELTRYTIKTTLFGGPARLITLGHDAPLGTASHFYPQFTIRVPFKTAAEMNAQAAIDEAEQIGMTYLLILNDWRKK